MPPEQDNAYLRQIDLFRGLGEEALAALRQVARTRSVRTNTYLFHQGDAAVALYVVTAGRVKLTQITPEGHQVLLRVVGPGETFGAVAVLAGMLYPVSAQIAEHCRLLIWNGEAVLGLMERYPHLAINALRVLAGHVREFQDRYRELATERVERRVARALVRLARQVGRKVDEGIYIDLALTRQDLAEMTGTTRYTVSRMLSGWEAQGLIEAGRERVLIKQPHALVVIAEDLPPDQPPAQSSDE